MPFPFSRFLVSDRVGHPPFPAKSVECVSFHTRFRLSAASSVIVITLFWLLSDPFAGACCRELSEWLVALLVNLFFVCACFRTLSPGSFRQSLTLIFTICSSLAAFSFSLVGEEEYANIRDLLIHFLCLPIPLIFPPPPLFSPPHLFPTSQIYFHDFDILFSRFLNFLSFFPPLFSHNFTFATIRSHPLYEEHIIVFFQHCLI